MYSGNEAVHKTPAPEKPVLLLVDDDPLIAESLALALEDDYVVYTSATRGKTKSLLQTAETQPALALVDLGLPPTPHAPDEGFTLISELLAFNRQIRILVLSGQSERENIQHALTLGAVDFVPKPCDIELLKTRLQHQLMLLDAEIRAESETAADEPALLGNSTAMQMLRSLISQFADSPFSILIEGESGSGKELVARQLHAESSRAQEPFLTINCAAFTPELLEAQLFGHARGAFTGAASDRAGFFEAAGSGSLLLDEIGELPLELQSKLLRVLENGEYYRLGETRPRQASCRIIAATNRDLRAEVRNGSFRQDLFHRLGVLSLSVPPLRERGADCLDLVDYFCRVYAPQAQPFRLTPAAREELGSYAFPGNVRELRNIVIRLLTKYPGAEVDAGPLRAELESTVYDEPVSASEQTPADDSGAAVEHDLQSPGFDLDTRLRQWEQQYIDAAMRLSEGNLSRAARLLGINRTTLYSRIQRLEKEGQG
ncbi:DNA-binding NtrC family response regulator [Methylohalomonas lacus]|uniref:DNA-binding NtrC family response regulator n=1 Tax=Methylohalomonas lacus TaxID=398773 RepID=A0AAE3HLF5_9GAMM|nr:sigma-54 dependent transcriptional regulator [Methylohalomonas lacus]MCS3904414.1 DNA-binding NtrC family response regulator [Methylohalomonas lacus]